MSTITLRPLTTVATEGPPAVTGAGNPADATNDDSDASYVDFAAGDLVRLSLDALTMPAGGVLKGVSLRARARAVTSAGYLSLIARDPGYVAEAGSTIAIGPLVTYTFVYAATDYWTDALLDTATLQIYHSAGGSVRVFEAYVDAIVVEQPVVDVLAFPAGLGAATNRPVVRWENTLDPDGGPQVSYHVKVFSSAQYGAGGFDPATSPSVEQANIAGADASWRPTTPLPDDSYRFYVQTRQAGALGGVPTSDWEFEAITIALDVPNVPDEFELTAEPAEGRITILLHSDDSGAADTDWMELERSDDGGETWLPVRCPDGLGGLLPGGGTLLVADYEAPNGVEVTYRARSLADYGADGYGYSAWINASVTWGSSQWWLKDPLFPSLNMPVTLRAYGPVLRAARQGTFQAVGSSLPIVVRDTRAGATGRTIIHTTTTARRDQLEALLASTRTLLLQGPALHGEPDRYVSVGDVEPARLVDNANHPRRDIPLPWTEVARPDGGQDAAPYVSDGEVDGGMEELVLV